MRDGRRRDVGGARRCIQWGGSVRRAASDQTDARKSALHGRMVDSVEEQALFRLYLFLRPFIPCSNSPSI